MNYKDIECPYCNHPQNINHYDGQGYEEGVLHSQECVKCEKTFTYTTSISFFYESYQADCLNDSEHIWELTHTHPKFFSKMRCKTCEQERNLTDQEKIQYEIPEKYIP